MLYTNGNMQKVATCRVKLYELFPREDDCRSSVINCDQKDTDNTDNTYRTENYEDTDDTGTADQNGIDVVNNEDNNSCRSF